LTLKGADKTPTKEGTAAQSDVSVGKAQFTPKSNLEEDTSAIETHNNTTGNFNKAGDRHGRQQKYQGNLTQITPQSFKDSTDPSRRPMNYTEHDADSNYDTSLINSSRRGNNPVA
jgi:hypothetical protein